MNIKNIKLSEVVTQKLTKVNWSIDREIVIDDWQEKLSHFGLKGHELSIALLKNLGGLEVDSLMFNPLIETSLMFEELNEINNESNFIFFPIGVITGLDIMIVVEEKGKIFGMMSGMIFRYGNNIESSLNNLMDERSIEDVGWDYEKW